MLEVLYVFINILKKKLEITPKIQGRYYQCPKTFVLNVCRTLAAIANKVPALPICMLHWKQEHCTTPQTKLPERREERKRDDGGVDVLACMSDKNLVYAPGKCFLFLEENVALGISTLSKKCSRYYGPLILS